MDRQLNRSRGAGRTDERDPLIKKANHGYRGPGRILNGLRQEVQDRKHKERKFPCTFFALNAINVHIFPKNFVFTTLSEKPVWSLIELVLCFGLKQASGVGAGSSSQTPSLCSFPVKTFFGGEKKPLSARFLIL